MTADTAHVHDRLKELVVRCRDGVGGCVEGSVTEVGDEVLSGGEPRLLTFGIADEEVWDVGLPCRGEIDVWVERFQP